MGIRRPGGLLPLRAGDLEARTTSSGGCCALPDTFESVRMCSVYIPVAVFAEKTLGFQRTTGEALTVSRNVFWTQNDSQPPQDCY